MSRVNVYFRDTTMLHVAYHLVWSCVGIDNSTGRVCVCVGGGGGEGRVRMYRR